MIKVFISQPMSNLPQDAILMRRKMIERKVQAEADGPPHDHNYFANSRVYFLDSFIEGAKDVNALFCLGHALQVLSKADVAVFAEGWQNSRGCQIEHLCAEKYGIDILEEGVHI